VLHYQKECDMGKARIQILESHAFKDSVIDNLTAQLQELRELVMRGQRNQELTKNKELEDNTSSSGY